MLTQLQEVGVQNHHEYKLSQHRMASNGNSKNACWQGHREGNYCKLLVRYKSVLPLWKTAESFLLKLKTELPSVSAIPLHAHILRKGNQEAEEIPVLLCLLQHYSS